MTDTQVRENFTVLKTLEGRDVLVNVNAVAYLETAPGNANQTHVYFGPGSPLVVTQPFNLVVEKLALLG